MTTLTDPARELADICERLADASAGTRGDQFVANRLGVDAWSTEFFQIIFTLSQRADDLIDIINALDMDADLKEQAASHVTQIKQAFSQTGLTHSWSHASTVYLTPANVGPVKMLSAQVRRTHAYPKLSLDETEELLAEVDELLDWLSGHQIKEQDFIRQAIIEGLQQFRFRLQRLAGVGLHASLVARCNRSVHGA